ncbi:MAG: putative sugar O-methyltransferase [Campylobacteraceae bacterium]|nr:putative sugar O-methyltransferase [Campylobacteraceae bacterium]
MNTKKFNLLDTMLEEMASQSILYKPTPFWAEGSKVIIEELYDKGVENFRALNSPRSFFVPTYSFPEYSSHNELYSNISGTLKGSFSDTRLNTRINKLFSGELLALSDYRVLEASNKDIAPYTDRVSESAVGNPIERFSFENRFFSRSFLNYTLGLNFLKQYVDTSIIHTVLEIGGGYGTLGEILLGDERNDCFYINVDIPPVAFVSTYYLQNVFGKENIADYEDLKDESILDIATLKKRYKAINTCAWQIEKLHGKIDLFVNFISFQEMEPEVVKNYCLHVERLQPSYVLLRNMEEGKKKKSKDTLYGVENPILGNDYDTFLPNYKLIAEDSTTFGYVTEDGFHSQLRLYERKMK